MTFRFTKSLIACILTASLIGCSGTADSPESGKEPTPKATAAEPVTLKMLSHNAVNEEFNQLFIEPLKKKLPHITLEVKQIDGNSDLIRQMVSTGDIPDLFYTNNGNIKMFNDLGLLEDLTPLMKQHQVDLGRFQEHLLNDVRYAVSGQGALYGLPIETTFHALYYNKSIFDKFGVPYPKDGMTWDETVQLAEKVTRMENGVQYRGLDPNGVTRLAQPLGLLFDENGKAVVNSERWKSIFELGKRIYSIPGNEPSPKSDERARNGFIKSQTIAMFSELNIFSQLVEPTKTGLDWDVVQHPYFKENPNTFGNASVLIPLIMKTSKHKDAAIEVVKTMASDEMQLELSKLGRMSTLKSPEVQRAFGESNPLLKGKNIQGIFKSKSVKYPDYSVFRSEEDRIVRAQFDNYLAGKADVNTTLRQAEDEINKLMQSGLSK